VRVEPRSQITARIERALRPGAALAVDGDGTLWSGDIGEDFFHALVERGDFRDAAVDAMRRDAREFGISDVGDGVAIAARLFAAYQEERFPEERICELMAWASASWSRRELRAFASELVRARKLRDRLHAEVVRVVEWARGAGVEVFLVSASPRGVIEESARLVGIDEAHVIAATPRWDGDRMLAEVERPIPYGPGKVTGLERALGERPLVAAFGDNAFDVAMLRKARVPVAVRPKDRLRARAAEVEGIVEIEREEP
jgi:phosphoserine phosphatase